MHNNTTRRFNPQKNTTPKTPHGVNRVLPTPPNSTTRAEEDSANSRPATAQPGTAPRLPLSRFSRQRNDQTNQVNSPARASKTQGPSGGDAARAHRPFGQPSGLLPPLSRHSSPPLIPLPGLAHLVQQRKAPGSRFSSPVSSPAPEVRVTATATTVLANLEDPRAHTSASTLFKPSRIAVTNTPEDDEEEVSYQLTASTHQENARAQSVAMDFQDDYHEQAPGSPSPTSFSKRRAEEHDAHVSAKRLRSSHHQVVIYIPFYYIYAKSSTLS